MAIETREREKVLFTIEEAQDYLGVSRPTIYRLLDLNQLRRVKIGKAARITRASLEAFVERLEEETNG